MALTVSDIVYLLTTRGLRQYDREAISQLDHALQCAHLAEQAGEQPATVAACLLHDLGHLLAPRLDSQGDGPRERDDLHQYVALPFLSHLFPPSVLNPVRLHVDAKRYLCAVDPGYWATLSDVSKHSLELQGGIFSTEQAEAFAEQPHAQEAARLRRYDDRAKVAGAVTPPLDHYVPLLESLALD